MSVTTITLHIIRIQLNESSMIRLRRDCGLVKIIITMFISHMLMVLMGVAIVASWVVLLILATTKIYERFF